MKWTAEKVDAHVGQRMRELREALGVSQARLGRHLGLTFSQVQKYEGGANRISAGRLYLIAEFFDVPVQHFFEGLAGGKPAISSPETNVSALAALDHAFLSIPDDETRRSVLALVRSISAPFSHSHAKPLRPANGEGLAVMTLSNPSSSVRK